jgi:hypothetical protein
MKQYIYSCARQTLDDFAPFPLAFTTCKEFLTFITEFQMSQKSRHSQFQLIERDFNYRVRDQLLYKEKLESRAYSFETLLYQSQNKETILQSLKKKIDAETLLELTLQSTPGDAYDRLLNYISLHPYNEDPLLLGYAGVMRWQQGKRFAEQAKSYLVQSIEREFNSYFMFVLHEILMHLEQWKELERILMEHLDDIYAVNLLLACTEHDVEWSFDPADMFKTSLHLDPFFSLDFFIRFQKYLSEQEMVEALATRIEYDFHDEACWSVLLEHVHHLTQSESLQVWKERRTWWPKHMLDRLELQ